MALYSPTRTIQTSRQSKRKIDNKVNSYIVVVTQQSFSDEVVCCFVFVDSKRGYPLWGDAEYDKLVQLLPLSLLPLTAPSDSVGVFTPGVRMGAVQEAHFQLDFLQV